MPIAFEVRGAIVVVTFDAKRTADAAEQEVSAVGEPPLGAPDHRTVTWNGEQAGEVYRFGDGKWSYVERNACGKGGFASDVEAARELADRYGYFRLNGWIYRPVGGWQEWRRHPVWIVTGNGHRSSRATTLAEMEALKAASTERVPHVKKIEDAVACEADKPNGARCAYCEATSEEEAGA